MPYIMGTYMDSLRQKIIGVKNPDPRPVSRVLIMVQPLTVSVILGKLCKQFTTSFSLV